MTAPAPIASSGAPLVRRLALVSVLASGVLLAGCATGPDPRDPYEPFNRSVYNFNQKLDDAVLKPVATAYHDNLPSPVRTGVHNFFGNIEDAWSMVNSLLQLKVADAAESFFRVTINTTIGFGGLLDWATEMRLEKNREDFGQTLGHYGVPSGPYLVLPVLGPSTVRDTAALPIDYKGDLVNQVDPSGSRYGLKAVDLIDTRARLLRASSLVEDVALDRYTFTRDAYLQMRRADVFEGHPPELPEDPKE